MDTPIDQNTPEQEAVPMKNIIESVQESFSIDPDAFAARFDPVVGKVSGLFDEIEKRKKDTAMASISKQADELKESGKTDKEVTEFIKTAEKSLKDESLGSESFQKFKGDLEGIIKSVKGGASIEERSEKSKDLLSQAKLLNELSESGDIEIDKDELQSLNEAIAMLVEGIQPRALSARLSAAGIEFGKGVGESLERQLSRSVGVLEDSIVSLGDDFAPLGFLLQGVIDIGKSIIESMWKTFKGSISRSLERRRQAKLTKLESKISNKPKTEIVESRKEKKRAAIERKESPVNKKPQKVELTRKNVKQISKDSNTGDRTEIVENALLAQILRQLKKNGRKDNDQKLPLMMRIMPLLMIVPSILSVILGTVITATTAIVGAILASNPITLMIIAAVIGIGVAFAMYGDQIIEWLRNVWGKVTELGSQIMSGLRELGSSIIDGIKEGLQVMLDYGKEKVAKAKDAIVDTAESATRAIPIVGDTIVDDVIPKAGELASTSIDAVSSGAKSIYNITKNFFTGEQQVEAEKKLKMGGEKVTNLNPTKNLKVNNTIEAAESSKDNIAEIVSMAARKDELEKGDAIEMAKANEAQKSQVVVQPQPVRSDTTVINNNRSTSTFVNKTDPVFPERYYNQKSRDAFAN